MGRSNISVKFTLPPPMTLVQRSRGGGEGRHPPHHPSTNHQYEKENRVGVVNISSREENRRLSHILNRGEHTDKSLRKLASDISELSNKDGGWWEKCGAVGTQTTVMQGVNTNMGEQVRLMATAPNMAFYSRPKRPSLWSNTRNRGRFRTEVETSSHQRQLQCSSDSMKTSSSERGTINGVTAGKYGTSTVTTRSDSRDIPPSCHLPSKRASPSW